MSGGKNNMPRISVGIPVYNGEAFLAEALACLSRQDVADAEFIICNNASTDATAQIAAEFAGRDPRFRIINQTETKPADQNFSDVLAAASGEFFCWRAADDLSSDNFLSELAWLLAGDPKCMLAACSVDNIRGADPSVIRTRRLPEGHIGNTGLWHRLRLMHTVRAAAFYGLWRRDEIIPLLAAARSGFPYLVAQDVLILLSPLLQGRIATTNKAVFVQRLKPKGDGQNHIPFYAIRDPAKQAKVRATFMALALEQLRKLDAPWLHRLVLRGAIGLYVDRRVFRLWKIWLGQRQGRAETRTTG